MTTDTFAHDPDVAAAPFDWREVAEHLRVLVVAGVATGVVVVGIGSRVAMLILRLTSPERVNGLESDDGFEIGRVTLAGTYNLLLLGAAVGLIGAGAYRLVAPWLIGPLWFRRITTGAAAGAVVGSMLLHSDGVDFTALQPTWLAIGLFIALPAAFGVAIGVAVDRCAKVDSWTAQGRRRWGLPIVLLACFPLVVFIAPFVAAAVVVLYAAGQVEPLSKLRASPPYGVAVRAVWLAIAIAGLFAVVNDARNIARVAVSAGSTLLASVA